MSTAPASAPRQGPWTILEVVRWTTQRFAERGIDSPRLDAELLAAFAFGMSRVQLYTQFDRPLLDPELAAFRELVKRRQAGEPVAYLTGKKEFWSLEFVVDSRVLVPRPDTETLVELALEQLPNDLDTRVIDIGTGSGAIAIAIAKNRPKATVVAVDISPDALAVAQHNAERLGVAIAFLQGDLLLPARGQAGFDLITANLPYIPTGDIAGLSAEVRTEPRLALDGGSDGLDLVRRLIGTAQEFLKREGSLLLEIGQGQAQTVHRLLEEGGYRQPQIRSDLGGILRVVWGRRPI